MLAAAERGRAHDPGRHQHAPHAGGRHAQGAGGLGEARRKPTYIRAWTYYPSIPWWGPHYISEIAAGGALASTAIHITDVALWVAGSPGLVSVSGSTHRLFPHKRAETAPDPEARDRYDVEDIAAAHIRLDTGATFLLEGTWAHDRLDAHYSFEMICERGTVCFSPLSVLMDEEGKIVDRTPHRLCRAGTAPFLGGQREPGGLPGSSPPSARGPNRRRPRARSATFN